MEDPAREVPLVIQALTQSPPHIQRQTINTYFTPDASFTHPFCRTGSFADSRWLIWMIYRWYKIMSPRIDLTVHSVAFDPAIPRLYVDISQVFTIWAIPFYPPADVKLVTVLDLLYDKQQRLYFIKSQNDLYQVNEFLRFIFPGGAFLAKIWQFIATMFCVIGAILLWPVTFLEDRAKLQT
ncbi:MAG: hypothetical protein M1817_002014 [Caeruleum heppii]|nr:MAG: hypothetical protein M1817_002014 [Caeruleum heppii]